MISNHLSFLPLFNDGIAPYYTGNEKHRFNDIKTDLMYNMRPSYRYHIGYDRYEGSPISYWYFVTNIGAKSIILLEFYQIYRFSSRFSSIISFHPLFFEHIVCHPPTKLSTFFFFVSTDIISFFICFDVWSFRKIINIKIFITNFRNSLSIVCLCIFG